MGVMHRDTKFQTLNCRMKLAEPLVPDVHRIAKDPFIDLQERVLVSALMEIYDSFGQRNH
jgi:hypothetical protein